MTEAAPDAGDEQLAATAPDISISPSQAVLPGLHQPVVPVLLLIALCTAISGKPLDGVLMLTVAMLLVFDAASARLREFAPASLAPPALAADRSRIVSNRRGLGGLQPWRPAGCTPGSWAGTPGP
jgi:hypothetical protein